jgi:hypothetical protein
VIPELEDACFLIPWISSISPLLYLVEPDRVSLNACFIAAGLSPFNPAAGPWVE